MKVNWKTPERLLCLDVGFAHMGIAVWQPSADQFIFFQCLDTKKDKSRHVYVADDNMRRCQILASRLATIMDTYRPYAIIAELPHGGARGAIQMRAMAMSAAVVSTVSALRHTPLYSIQPNEIKRLIGDKGKVTKEQVIALVQKKFGLCLPGKPTDEHIADAMACLLVARKRLRDVIG